MPPPKIAASRLIPFRMRPDLERYALDLTGDKRLKPPAEIHEAYRLAESLGRQGVLNWREMKPVHYETFLRQMAPGKSDEQSPEAVAAHRTSTSCARFLGYMESEGAIDESPASRVIINKEGVVRKYDQTYPEFDGPIDRCFAKAALGQRGRSDVRALAGHFLCSGVRFWKHVTADHVEEFFRGEVERSVERGVSNFGNVQRRVRGVQAFFEWAERKEVVKENPAEGLYVTGKGRLYTARELPPRMQDTLATYCRKVLSKNTPGTAMTHAGYLREMMLYFAGEHGVEGWGSVRPGHYEQFVRTIWDRWVHNPENAQMRHAACSRFLDHTLSRSPAEGFKLELNGRLTVPGKPKEQLPRGFTPEVAGWTGIPGVAPGFEKEANAYWQRVVDRGNIGNRKRVEMMMRRVSHFLAERGVKNWNEVQPEHISAYGRALYDEKGGTDGGPLFSIVRTFFEDLERSGGRKDDPTVGFRLTVASGFVEPSPVSPALAKGAADHLHQMFPTADGSRSRKAYSAALLPLMAYMTASGVRNWAEMPPGTVKDYSLNVLPVAHNDPNANIHAHRRMIRAFCESMFPNNEKNPSRCMFPTQGPGVREYTRLLHPDERVHLSAYQQERLAKAGAGEGECDLTIPVLPKPYEPPLKSQARYIPAPLAPGE